MRAVFLVPLMLIASACQKEAKEALPSPPPAAMAAVKSLGQELKKELKAGLQKSPQEAVKVCSEKAQEIAKRAGSKGVKVGRVSLKNRNPENYPKEWMLKYIKAFHAGEVKKDFIVTELEGGKGAMLKPITTQPLCVTCHGKNVPDSLYSVIKERYPNDKAVGYEVGDIRGFFWAEWEQD